MTEDFYMKVGLAGTGWRAQMYVRVMKALGEEFEVSAVYVHSESSSCLLYTSGGGIYIRYAERNAGASVTESCGRSID